MYKGVLVCGYTHVCNHVDIRARDIALRFPQGSAHACAWHATAKHVEGQVQVRDKRFGARRQNPYLGNISTTRT